jgi:glycyl-tRNA synthetase beta subunit
MDRDVDLVFDRLEREKPAGKVIYEFRPYDEVAADIAAFFADRLEVWLRDRGQRHDLVGRGLCASATTTWCASWRG